MPVGPSSAACCSVSPTTASLRVANRLLRSQVWTSWAAEAEAVNRHPASRMGARAREREENMEEIGRGNGAPGRPEAAPVWPTGAEVATRPHTAGHAVPGGRET